jgi:hypothetical protein
MHNKCPFINAIFAGTLTSWERKVMLNMAKSSYTIST